eukprot:Gb_22822 [translate_table: standard]
MREKETLAFEDNNVAILHKEFLMRNMEVLGNNRWTCLMIFPILLLFILSCHTFTNATIHSQSRGGFHFDQSQPQVFLEVTRPIDVPPEQNPCSVLILHHDFGYTINKPPVEVPYNPPTECLKKWSKVVLEWKATCKGKQFDRIAAVWLSGVEIFRTCTAEPTPTGIEWTVEKDITKYSALLNTPKTLVVELGNIIDQTYTGMYHVNITLHFYQHKGQMSPSLNPADLVLPISNASPEDGGYWFQLQNASDVQSRKLQVPLNVYRAVIEIYVSFHMNDESWYANPPNEYVEANNLTNTPGNGAFREVIALIDGVVVGAVWPFPVVFTGGVNPLFWRPIVAIGSFDLPTYDLDITPFVGQLLDGKHHTFSLGVTNALNVWFVDANLHLWVDKKSAKTSGKLMEYEVPPYQPSLISNFKGLDGSFETYAERQISYMGWVESSHGNLTTQFTQGFKYTNKINYLNSGKVQIVHQTIQSNSGIIVETPSKVVQSAHVSRSFPLYLYFASADKGNGTSLETANISIASNVDACTVAPSGSSFRSLNNAQDAQGYFFVKNNLVISGLGSTQQTYNYQSTEGCYFRTKGYGVVHILGEAINCEFHAEQASEAMKWNWHFKRTLGQLMAPHFWFSVWNMICHFQMEEPEI